MHFNLTCGFCGRNIVPWASLFIFFCLLVYYLLSIFFFGYSLLGPWLVVFAWSYGFSFALVG